MMGALNSYRAKDLADLIEQKGICVACDFSDFYDRKESPLPTPNANWQRDMIVAALRLYATSVQP